MWTYMLYSSCVAVAISHQSHRILQLSNFSVCIFKQTYLSVSMFMIGKIVAVAVHCNLRLPDATPVIRPML